MAGLREVQACGRQITPKECLPGVIDCWKIIQKGACAQLGLKKRQPFTLGVLQHF